MGKIRVLLCNQDGVSAVLLLLQDLLRREPDFETLDHCTIPQAPEVAERVQPDILVFITGYPGSDEAELVRTQRELFPSALVIAVSLGMGEGDQPLEGGLDGVDRVVPADRALELPMYIREVVGQREPAPAT